MAEPEKFFFFFVCSLLVINFFFRWKNGPSLTYTKECREEKKKNPCRNKRRMGEEEQKKRKTSLVQDLDILIPSSTCLVQYHGQL